MREQGNCPPPIDLSDSFDISNRKIRYNPGVASNRPSAPPPDPRTNVPGLRAFVAVARLGAVGRAAEALGRTQPSISARVADLEGTWRTRLFHRAPRGMVLTPEGSRLLPLAERGL